MTAQLRVAIVGCGNIARRAHVPAWLADGRATIVALCDPSADARQQILDRFRLNCATADTLAEVLATEAPDIVDICSPTPYHYALARQALEAGCHVLIEKPPAPTAAQALDLANLARQYHRKVGVSFNYRYRDLVMSLKNAQNAGKLGKIVKVQITHHGPLVFGDAPWLWNEQQSKYLVWEFGIHFLDILVYLLGPHEEVISILPTLNAGIGHTTDLDITARFRDGAIGRLEIVADSTRHSSYFTRIDVYGTAMDAFVRWFPPSFTLVSGQVNPLSLLVGELRALWQIGSKILTREFLAQRNISHYRLVHAYASWVMDGARFPLAIDAVLPTLRLLEDAERRVPSYVVDNCPAQ